ncbi:MAG: OmpA family protein [Bacteroidetes bacterium]|nr:OmpA family protein [Bacteroidota bacterium]
MKYILLIVLILFIIFPGLKAQPQITVKKPPRTVMSGDTVTIEWEVTKATEFFIEGSDEYMPFTGSKTFIPDSAILLKFIARKGKNEVHKKVTVQVNRPEIYLLEVPDTVSDEEDIVIKWSIDYVETVRIENLADSLPYEGSITVRPDTTTTYVITGTNRNGRTITARKTVIVKYNEEIDHPVAIFEGQTAMVRFKFKNSRELYLNETKQKLHPLDSVALSPDSVTDYHLEVYRNSGDTLRTGFRILVSKPRIESFKAPAIIYEGQQAKLSWLAVGADKVRLAGISDTLPARGSITITPDRTNTYTLEINTGRSVITKSRTVDVREPEIAYVKGPQSIFAGENVTLFWNAPGVSKVRLAGINDKLPSKGKILLKPEETTTYIFEIKYNNKTKTREHRIHVNQRVLIKDTVNYEDLAINSPLQYEIFATNTEKYPEEIKLYLLVVDRDGRFVQNLTPPYGSKATADKFFKNLIEDAPSGKPQKVSSFSVEEIRNKAVVPCDINLTLDYSGSMAGTIGFLEAAVIKFIENKNDEDRISIVKFSDVLMPEVPLIQGRQQLLATYKQGEGFGGGTALYAGAHEGLLTLQKSGKNKKQVLFTDGYENSSMTYFGKRAVSGQELAEVAVGQGTKTDVVSFGDYVNEDLLMNLAFITGGNYYHLTKEEDILSVMDEISFLSRNYYIITYRPCKGDGEREIKLVVNTNKSETRTITRKIRIGTGFDLTDYEYSDDSYWSPGNNSWGGKKPVSPPQVLVLYEFDKDIIVDDFREKIDVFVNYMKKNPQTDIVLLGHTDLVGDSAYCVDLSERRCKSVENYMISQGIKESRIILEARGKSDPIWLVEDKSWKARENRRVEVILLK